MTVVILAGVALVLLAAFVVVSFSRRPSRPAITVEITAVTVLAILLSPIAWDHYWTLLLPAFLIVYDSREPNWLGPVGNYSFWCAAILTSGLSPLTLGASGFNAARHWGTYTIAAIVIYAALLALRNRLTTED